MSDYITNPLDSEQIVEFREGLEVEYSDVYDTTELKEAFEVIAFAAPYVVVINKETQTKGTLQFTHSPRFYFHFIPD